MKAFLDVFGTLVLGVLHGFDRLVFRGHLRQLTYVQGMQCYLNVNRVLLQNFDSHAKDRTAVLMAASLAEAQQQERPIVYLNSSLISKEDEARRIAQRDRIRDGLICVFKSVEPCWTFEVHRNRGRKRLELQGKQGKCSFLYHYRLHPQFGFMHARIQTWFPFAVQVYLNGREWLARQLEQAGLSYQRRDNKFLDVQDWSQAQALLDQQLQISWPEQLQAILQTLHPAGADLLGRMQVPYYWSVYQSEWASDIVFRSRADLERLYSPWLRQAITSYRSTDVLRFLGREVPLSGSVRPGFKGEVRSTLRRREEGVCIKHWLEGNSIKMYDADRNLRIETTINAPEGFKVYRAKENDPQGDKAWRKLRRGVADLQRRAEVSQAANERYASATAAVQATTPVKEVAAALCQRAREPGKHGTRKLRALNPLGVEDGALLEAVNDPKFVVPGLRNRDLVALLYEKPANTVAERRRRSARVTRQIRLLRGHGLLHKVPKTHRYQVSAEGRQAIAALLAARNANAEFLAKNAA